MTIILVSHFLELEVTQKKKHFYTWNSCKDKYHFIKL